MDVKIGAKKDGTITSAFIECRYSDGAFPGIWGMLGAMTSWACYDIKDFSLFIFNFYIAFDL